MWLKQKLTKSIKSTRPHTQRAKERERETERVRERDTVITHFSSCYFASFANSIYVSNLIFCQQLENTKIFLPTLNAAASFLISWACAGLSLCAICCCAVLACMHANSIMVFICRQIRGACSTISDSMQMYTDDMALHLQTSIKA